MQDGDRGALVTHISQAYPDRVEVRGRDLCGDLMGRLSFTEYFHLLLTGDEPTDEQRFFLDLLLVAIAEHGMMPTNVAARMTLAADPGSLQGAVAAGILGAGPVILGTAEPCAAAARGGAARVAAGGEPAAVALDEARAIRDAGGRMPGFGHPVHKPLDPRAERILELADARGVSGPHVLLARALARRGRRDLGQAADDERLDADRRRACSTSGFPPSTVKAVPILARTAEPARAPRRGAGEPDRLPLATKAEEAVAYEPRRRDARPGGRDPSVGRAARGRRRELPRRSSPTCSSARPSTARSSARPGSTRPRPPAGSADDREPARSPRSASCRETVTPDNPIGSHLCATRDEIVRIYSTSGTTGTPSYIPLTAGDLDNWVTGSARSYAASGVSAGAAHRLDLQRRAVRRRRRARRVRAHRPLPHPGRHREHRAADLAIELLGPEAVVLTPSYAAYLVEWAQERGIDLRGLDRRAGARRRRARRRRAGVPREARGGLGREGHRGDGDRRHRRLALGRVRGAGRHAPRRARLRPPGADRPRDRRRRSSSPTAPPASSC